MMDYQYLVRDFAQRTRHNLEFVRQAHRRDPTSVYEVTQLINSMLGLLVFPRERYVDSIPDKTLAELMADGWPIPKVVDGFSQVPNLNQLFRVLRNSISHCNIEFISDSRTLELKGLTVWNTHPRNGNTTWKATLTLEQLEELTDRFLDMLLNEIIERVPKHV